MSQSVSQATAQALPVLNTIRKGGVSSRTKKPVPPPPPPPGAPRRNANSNNTAAIDSGLAMYGNPSQTLYINNLNDKVQKDELKLCLYTLFSAYGAILDVVAVKTPKMRGQAHIVFAGVPSATAALRSLQGFLFLGKEMRISFAKSKSNVVARLDGSFNLPQAQAVPVGDIPMYAAPDENDADDYDDDSTAQQGVKRSRSEISENE
ncbi:uncharacterized protein V2V93DRAFT_371338 [Kockiozyma suomiensis]|uniref:uncharacterized protein n=1 Tax=Kockiozyma suomiensis TaxID=1337062 RepID=UPI003343CB77